MAGGIGSHPIRRPGSPPERSSPSATRAWTGFTKDDMRRALKHLDNELVLKFGTETHEPITLIAFGGYVAVTALKTRSQTRCIDIIINPATRNLPLMQNSLGKAIRTVGQAQDYPAGWMANSQVRRHIPARIVDNVGQQSIIQDVKLFNGVMLTVYAVSWGWFVGSKLMKIAVDSQLPPYDVVDAVAALRKINDARARNMTLSQAISLSNVFEGRIEDRAIDTVNQMYEQIFGHAGIIPV